MNMKWKLSTLALAAAVSFGASADVTLSVKGEITPGACTPVLGASDVDYGTINASTLTAVAPALNQLGNKTVSLAITCTAAVPVGITATDARADSRITLGGDTFLDNAGAAAVRLTQDRNTYGLGKINNVNIGVYSMAVDVAQVSATDSAGTSFTPDILSGMITSTSPLVTNDWVKTNNGFVLPVTSDPVSGTVVTFARAGTTVPTPIKSATVPLIISSAIQDVSSFGYNNGESIKLDGNATLSLVYL